ncbi:MAG: class I SAM-dependent methyltransferase [Bryobacteraceae bacterium]
MIAQNPKQQETWATGDFSMIGTGVTLVGELLCDSIPVHAGNRVLDIATGSGNTALAAARRGCRVTGADFVPALLERGRERAHAERLKIDFQEGDAEALPFPDASFDVVLSTFGAMFAAPQRATAEMLRVCRPGGKIGMANWTPEGFIAEMFRLASTYAPPPAGAEPPVKWGIPEVVRERFGSTVSGIRFVPRHVIMRHHTPRSWVDFFKTYFGPTIRAYEAAGERAAELDAALLDLATRYNQSGDQSLFVTADYIEVIATKA